MNDLTADEQPEAHPLLLRFRHRSPSLTSPASPIASAAHPDHSAASLFLEIHPDDAERLQVKDGECIVASAQTVTIRAIARLNPRISVGTALLGATDTASENTSRTTSPAMPTRSPNIAQVTVRPAGAPPPHD